MDAAGDHADPGHPSRTAACPTAALQDLTSAGHSGHGNAQTPDAHTGRRHRTPDSGHLDAQTSFYRTCGFQLTTARTQARRERRATRRRCPVCYQDGS